MMDYSSITCFSQFQQHSHLIHIHFFSGSWLVVSLSSRQTGPINDSSRAGIIKGQELSGMEGHGGAAFSLGFQREKKKSATAPYPWSLLLAGLPPCPSLHHSRSYPPVQQQHQVRYPRRLTFGGLPLHALLALTPLSHTATATSMQQPPWHRSPRQISGAFFMPSSHRSGLFWWIFVIINILNWIQDTTCHRVQTAHSRTPHHSSRAKAPTAPPPPPPLHPTYSEERYLTVWSARSLPPHSLTQKSSSAYLKISNKKKNPPGP
ncbi:hypothetical protein BDP55DRAFT_381763 [Colletotrichum godetiae]|uniref:Uncharacterized protein n=1 Tax=Colletotrichum godetiae TaxID=1209918 RepID=A0AAJ0AT44_9PEZI|nr:uncharacterized protein BDP55DRAFT_381763 [Colletotrichum godetiae]KAK1689880.1 hypothetical protein BDP55DRAFT_381763 [Colletotrichum godetiae]